MRWVDNLTELALFFIGIFPAGFAVGFVASMIRNTPPRKAQP